MNTLQRAESGRIWLKPGEWRSTFDEGVLTAHISCPECGVSGSLRDSHQIDGYGYVTPSLVCNCGYHEYIRLDGWDDLTVAENSCKHERVEARGRKRFCLDCEKLLFKVSILERTVE